MDRWPDAAPRAREVEIFQRLNTLAPGAVGAEELTPEELPFLRFEAEAQELFDGWRADLEHRLYHDKRHERSGSDREQRRCLGKAIDLGGHVTANYDFQPTPQAAPLASRGASSFPGTGARAPVLVQDGALVRIVAFG